MAKYQDGTEFYNYRIEDCCVIVGFNEPMNRYMVQSNLSITIGLWTEQDIDVVMSKQDRIVAYAKQAKEQEETDKKQKQEEIATYENVYGFCDNMTSMRKGKVLATLNRTVRYKGEFLTRKDWIRQLLNMSYVPVMKNDSHVMTNGDSFFVVSKTEYEYAAYLVDQD